MNGEVFREKVIIGNPIIVIHQHHDNISMSEELLCKTKYDTIRYILTGEENGNRY
jgi:hypothetical protein